MQANVYIVCRVVETDLDSGHTTTATTPLSAYSKQESAVSYAYEIGKIVGDELRIRQLTSVDPMPEVCRSGGYQVWLLRWLWQVLLLCLWPEPFQSLITLVCIQTAHTDKQVDKHQLR